MKRDIKKPISWVLIKVGQNEEQNPSDILAKTTN